MKPSRRKTRFNKHRTERFPSEWPPPPFASWKDPGIKIASVKVLRFTIVTTRQLLDGLQSQTWKSWLLLKEYGYCWRIPVQKYKYSHRGIQLRHGGIDHCWMTHFVPRLNSKVCWTLWPVQWLDYQLYIWTSSIILWDVGSILRHFTPGISAAWVIIAVSGGDEDILKPGLWIWVQLLARTWASLETAPLTATTLEVHWLHRSWHHYERPTPCKDWTFLGRIRLNKPPFARPMSHDVTMLHTNQGHPKGIHTDVVDGLDKFWH